ncbi:uncharacterized protein MKZ38_000891 [Zalerion maritima]|uniref:Carbohydrate kinase PfkB domain-containing protein n=1 Tax=Zalerion maritima TaxID=339359 RepID=A0AAD5WV39_9PEZI|nr:uncharacterized protein MKZ38_000891 [Zalerion maritima]
MKHLFAIGAVYLDTILSVSSFPAEDSKLRATQIQVRRGGNVSNSLEVLKQLLEQWAREKVKLHLISTLPEKGSPALESIRSSFSASGGELDLETCLYREGCQQPASSYIIRNASTSSRTIVNYNDLPEMSVEEFAGILSNFKGDGGGESWWHFEGRIPDVTLECIKLVRKSLPTAIVSVEIEKPGREGLQALAAEADMVFYSRSYAESTGESRETFPSFLQRQAAGTTCKASIGAGDTFIAGVLYSAMWHGADWDAKGIVSFAVELASRKVQQEGFGGLGAEVKKEFPRYFDQ